MPSHPSEYDGEAPIVKHNYTRHLPFREGEEFAKVHLSLVGMDPCHKSVK